MKCINELKTKENSFSEKLDGVEKGFASSSKKKCFLQKRLFFSFPSSSLQQKWQLHLRLLQKIKMVFFVCNFLS
jgi:hypothetical protein